MISAVHLLVERPHVEAARSLEHCLFRRVFSAAPVATSSFVLKANASLADICHGRREWVRLVLAGFSVAEVSVKSAMRSARRYRYSTASPRRKPLYVSVF
jgi:hypothetical protein